MKSLTVSELDRIVEQLQPLVGYRLQEVKVQERDLILGLWGEEGLKWLWMDLTPLRPLLLVMDQLPQKIREKTKPIKLFMKANALNLRISHVKRMKEYGRVVVLSLSSAETEEAGKIEMRLFPHGQNVLVEASGKSINWAKPKDLPPLNESEETISLDGRSYEEILNEWLDEKRGRTKNPQTPTSKDQAQKQLEKLIKKKKKAIEKVEDDLERKEHSLWREVGEWIKTEQSLNVPEEWTGYVDSKESLAENIERCFKKAKDTEGKMSGTQERLEILRRELKDLEAVSNPQAYLQKQQNSARPKSKDRNQKTKYKGRSLTVSADIEAVAGKSAADNIKLLRRARPWDIWLHLKDYPGSHGFIFRNKKTEVSDEVIRRVGRWLVETTFADKAKNKSGEKLDLLVTECRYVRPIKGDRLGRVNYSNERVLTVSLP